MKLFVRWSTTLGIVGSVLLGGLPGIGNQQAQALPEDQLVQKLRQVPVFMIGNADGGILSQCFDPTTRQEVRCDEAKPNNAAAAPKKVVVSFAFISQRDAQTVLQRLKTEQPEKGRNLQIVPRPLAYVYQVTQSSKDASNQMVIDFLPVQQQVTTALSLLQQSGKSVQEYKGVPLFVATVAKPGQPNNQEYLALGEGNDQIIPLFFEKEQLQRMVDDFKQKRPDVASNITVQVVNLERVIEAWRTSNDPILNKFVLYPSQESLQFIQSIAPAQQRPAPGNQQRPQ